MLLALTLRAAADNFGMPRSAALRARRMTTSTATLTNSCSIMKPTRRLKPKSPPAAAVHAGPATPARPGT
jgi:hypothetical protein